MHSKSCPVLLALTCLSACGRSAEPGSLEPLPSPFSPAAAVVPQPAEGAGPGDSILISSPIVVATTGPGAERLGPALATWVREQSELLGVRHIVGDADSASIVVHTGAGADEARGGDASVGEDESYTIDVAPRSIRIEAAGPAGGFYALQTLRQIVSPAPGGLKVAALRVSDRPRFPYRGMHLDVGRHFFPPEFVKRYIDLISRFKFNRFHWHLTEDQGWRLQIDAYPRLTEVSSCRAETVVEKNFDPFVGDGQRYCGFYTKEEVRDIVAYAAERFVTIVPEIEMPGHSLAALAAYPHLACTDGPFEVGTRWGVYDDIYCPTEETFEFLETVLGEVLELFPGRFIHVGGDEAPKLRWEESLEAQAVIRREGLAGEAELQSWFIRRIEAFLSARGRRLIGWDEILEGGLAPGAVVMSWRGMSGGIEAARQGHDVVMTPGSHVYFDHYQGDPEHEPFAIGGFTTLRRVYSFEPVPEELSAEETRHVLGAQANVWTEYMKTTEHVEYMAFPRALALAEVVWSPASVRDWESFRGRLPSVLTYLDRLGVNYRIPSVEGLERDLLTLDDRGVVELDVPLTDAVIRYTLDGSDPTESSAEYPGALHLDLGGAPVTVTARAFLPDGRVSAPTSATFRRAHLAAPLAFPAERLAPGVARRLVEGEFTSVDELPGPATDADEAENEVAGVVPVPGLSGDEPPDHFGLLFEGVIRVPDDGIYEFALDSDDGSRLEIGTEVVVDHDGYHGMNRRTGQVALQRGTHRVAIRYFQAGGAKGLELGVRAPGEAGIRPVPAGWLWHVEDSAP